METKSDPLFLKPVPLDLKLASNETSVSLVSSSTAAGLNERKQVSITVQLSLTSKNSGRLKVLEIQLTDEQDPFFLYTLFIGEDDFHALRQEQNLLVDFQQFPLKFIELLDECTRCKSQESPRFLGKLTAQETGQPAVLSIIETNSFKHITHLSLCFIPGNDNTVKKYLATLTEIAHLKSQLETTTSSLCGKLESAETRANSVTLELDKLRISHTEQLTKCQIKAAEELAQEREKLMRELESQRRTADREKRETELQYESEVRVTHQLLISKLKQLHQKYTTVNTTHTHLLSHTQALESTLSNNNKQIDALNKQLATCRQEVVSLEQTLKSHERRLFELDQESKSTKEKLDYAESVIRQKEESLHRANEAASAAGSSKTKAEETLEAYKAQHSFLEESLKKASEEINKGNEIIRKLQAELKNSKSKIKLKNVVTLQQEKLLDERSSTIDSLQKELNQVKETLDKKILELEAANGRVSELNKKLDESKQLIVDNNHVIEWLHKQLNEEAMSRPVASSAPVGYTGTIDFDKYLAPGRKSPTHYPRYTPASENIPPHPIKPARPGTGSRTSPTAKPNAPAPPNKSPSYHASGPHHFKVSTSNMATGASHLSSHLTSNAHTLGQHHGVAKYPLKSNANLDNTAKSNYF